MNLKLLLALSLLPIVSTEIVYARTDRLDLAESDQWNKTCGMPSTSRKVPFKVMVYVSKEGGATKKCIGVILNKRFVLTTATCYYNREVNNYNNDADMRLMTNPKNTKVVVCADDGMSCESGKGPKEVGVKKILYPQVIHYSKDYETAADIALLEIEGEFTDDRAVCTPSEKHSFRGQKVFLISEDINDAPFMEGEWEWKGERTCGDATLCAETYTFKPATAMATKPSNGLFYVRKDDRLYLLGTLKYEGDSPKIMAIFPLFHDFVCSNTGDCGDGYDKYMYMRQTRVVVNGIPLPQVSHCDVVFTNCKYDPLFFRFIPPTEMEDLQKNCGKELTPPSGTTKNKWQQFPHMAAIVNKGRVCSGAFISQVHVITVAHCLFQYDKERNIDEFPALRDKQPGQYMNTADLEVRYGSECYADGDLNLESCELPEQANSIKTSKVRNIIVEGLKGSSAHWRYKYQLVLLELEQPTSKDVVIPICTYPGLMARDNSLPREGDDSFDFTAAGNPLAPNTFVIGRGKKIRVTDCSEFLEDNRVQDYNCRDENVDVELSKANPASSFTKSSVGFLGSQLSYHNKTAKTRYLYGLAHYYSPHGKDNRLGAFYPIWRNERFICWFTGVCYNGRPSNDDNRHFQIYTPEYRLTRSIMDAPVQRAGKTNLSNYDIVMLEELDTQW